MISLVETQAQKFKVKQIPSIVRGMASEANKTPDGKSLVSISCEVEKLH
jgi:hypothetical protein